MDDYIVTIQSKGRAELLSTHTMPLFPDATVVCPEDECAAYEKVAKHVIGHDVQGLTATRQWTLDHFKEQTVFMLDDDVSKVLAIVGTKSRTYKEPEDVIRIVENGIYCLQDLELSLLYFQINPSPLFFQATEPIKFTGAFASHAYAVNGRELVYDEKMILHEDVDLTLLSLLKSRAVLFDARFCFVHGLLGSGKGGIQSQRTECLLDEADRRLTNKWGIYVGTGKSRNASVRNTHTYVRRKNSLAVFKE